MTKLSDFYLHPAKVFLVLALFFGLIFLFLTPPYQVSDEDNHFYRAYQLSELGIVGHKNQLGAGGTLPRSLLETKNSFDYLAQEKTHKLNFNLVRTGLTRPLERQDKTPINFPNTVLYPPVPYIPAAFGIAVLRQFDAPPLVLMYTARLLTFIAWLLLTYMAIKITPKGKWVFCVLALMPMSLFTGASLSADALTNGLSFLAVALFFRYAMTKDLLTRRDYLILLGTSAGLMLSKSPYFILALLYLLLPRAKFKSLKNYYLFAGSLALGMLLMFVVWGHVTKGLYTNYRVTYDLVNGQLIHAHQQASFILHKPLSYLAAIYNSYFTGVGDARIMGYVGMLGWLTFLPLWFVIFNFGLIATALGWMPDDEQKNLVKLKNWQKLLIASVGVVTILAFTTLAYLTYTPVGKSIVDGIQGRYFIPISVLLVAFFGFKSKAKTPEYQKLCKLMTLGMALMLVSSVVVIVLRYYVHSGPRTL